MGYTFKIGNAIPTFSKEDDTLSACWEVENTTHEKAPTFPNDEMTGNSNSRSPSYSGWSEFCKDAGIYELFYDERGHLLGGHPGCIIITKDHVDKVRDAKVKRESVATKPAGFYGSPVMNKDTEKLENTYDATLARLIWLAWWLEWAVNNCETPAIENY